MKERTLRVAVGMGLMALVGCAAKGEVVTLDIRAVLPPAEVKGKNGDSVSVLMTAFEDARAAKSRLGTRRHLWGGESYFDVPGSNSGEVVAEITADYLKSKGWRVELAKAQAPSSAVGSEVMLSGTVLDFLVDADSKFMRTEITVKTRVLVEAKNQEDGSWVRMTLNGAGSECVFWFKPEDAQRLLSDVLTDSLDRFVKSTKVENRLLRLK